MKSWFSKHAKLKRWILIILIGIIFICFSISKILVLNQINAKDIIEVIISFTTGFILTVVGLVNFNKRTIELAIESTDDRMENRKNININQLIFNKKIYDKRPKIVVIGGGSGTNAVLEGLKSYSSNITAIIDTANFGEDKTYSRKITNTIPLDNVRDALIALSPKMDQMTNLLTHRFDEDNLLNSLDFSDIFFKALKDTSKDYANAIKKSAEILNITGKILPVSFEEMNLIAELENGLIIDEKNNIEKIVYERFTSINRIKLNPSVVKPAPGVIDAIKQADAIVIRPGALYTNIIPSLLVNNVARTIKESKALKIYISNIMTTPGQTDNYTLKDHINAIIDHVGPIIDYCIYDTGEVSPDYIKKYNKNGQELIEQDKSGIKNIHFIKKDLSCIKNQKVRHDSRKTAISIIEIICDDLRYKDRMQDPEYLMLSNKLNMEKELAKTKKKRRRKNERKKVLHKKSKWGVKYEQRIVSMKEADLELKRNPKTKKASKVQKRPDIRQKKKEKMQKN